MSKYKLVAFGAVSLVTLLLTFLVFRQKDRAQAQQINPYGFLPSLSQVNFGDLTTGASPVTSLSLTNSTAAPITIAQIQTNNGEFEIDQAHTACPMSGADLPVGESCNLSVKFTPSGPGSRVGMIKVISNAPNSPQIILLQGQNGSPPPSAAISVDMSQVSDAVQPVSGQTLGQGTARITSRSPRILPSTLPPGTTVALPARVSPNVAPNSPGLPDASFSGGGPVTINGQYSQEFPEDASVAEGNGYVLAASNDQITIHQTDGTLVANKNEQSFWSQITEGSFVTDVTVGYSWATNRFYIAVMDQSLTDIFYLAASQTGNPNGKWWFFSLVACPDSPEGDRPILAPGDNYLLLTSQCFDSPTNHGGFYAINMQNLLNGSTGNPSLQTIPNYFSPVTDSLKSDTTTMYLMQPMVDSQSNVSLSLATLSSTGVYNPNAVVNYPLGIQGGQIPPPGGQASDGHAPACSSCIAWDNTTGVDEAYKIANTAFNGGFGYDTIYTSLSVSTQVSGFPLGELILAAIQPDAPAGQQSYALSYSPGLGSGAANLYTYGSISGACYGTPGYSNGCCRGGQFLLGFDDIVTSGLPAAAYAPGTLTPSGGLAFTAGLSIFQNSTAQSGEWPQPGYPAYTNLCVALGGSNSNAFCRWGDYSFSSWNIGTGANWWTDANYAYPVTLSGGPAAALADWVASVKVPAPAACP